MNKQLITLNVNDIDYDLVVESGETLVNVIRHKIGLTGTKKGCDEGDCGACSVLIDGHVAASCTTLAIDVQGKKITTIEGVMKDGVLHPVQKAFIEKAAIQCGFCTPGMVMSTLELLSINPDTTEDEIRDFLRGNICRCTGYVKIVDAVQEAARVMREEDTPAAEEEKKRIQAEKAARVVRKEAAGA